ncbi:TetR/AcrR family transcriptional regulator [Roseovarius faecimaris]|uniref:TetR/AcrR family transcriptional regulator n=1 Tax=Roseovarius faecimaris TaxID=2494550 RepID=UPI0018E00C95|nr:TetR/AcrR family transcriptional regulator [Roseovarius faecimaris]
MKDTEQEDRRREILSHGLSVLIEKGWRGASMIAIARKASASKETLYNWFGDKAGFFGALIRANATALDKALPEDFASMPLEEGLHAFGRELLTLVCGDASVAINRAAIADAGGDATLGKTLIGEGKAKSLPKLAAWLSRHMELDNPTEAAERFVVLVKGEAQLERLLGVANPPSEKEITAQVDRAVRDFLMLYQR